MILFMTKPCCLFPHSNTYVKICFTSLSTLTEKLKYKSKPHSALEYKFRLFNIIITVLDILMQFVLQQLQFEKLNLNKKAVL